MAGELVLIVEDEPDIMELVRYNLEKQGYRTDWARDGREALRKIRSREFSLVILDLMLPGMDGLEVCRAVRGDAALSSLPIIMLTAKGEEVDRVVGLEVGADDYISKPFSPRELVARVRAVLRRAGREGAPAEARVIRAGGLEIDAGRFAVVRDGAAVALSAMEFRLLLYLAERPGRVLSRDVLLDAVWGDESFVEPRTVDVHIRRLREKIEADPSNPVYIMTKRGVGYYFAEAEAEGGR
ncbi:MAG: response regulator transcription factor [Thermodesulfovibrionales bacterium]